MTTFLKNNTTDNLMIEGLGLLLTPNDLYELTDSFAHEELCEDVSLKKKIQDKTVSLFIDTRELTVAESISYLTVDSVMEDSENERWFYSNGIKTVITPFTQLRVSGRPLELSDGVTIILEEGADIIMD